MKRIVSGPLCVAMVSLFGVLFVSLPAVASPPLGRVIYSANLSSPVVGWYQSSWSTFEDGAYVIRTPSVGQNFIREPPNLIRPHAAITLRASLNTSTSAQSAFGIYCLADYKKAGLGITFLVHRNDEWTIYEQEGNDPQKLLASGSAPNLNVVRPTSVTAVCDALPGKMKLGLYVNGQMVSSLTEPSPKLVTPWLIRLDAYRATSAPTTVSAKSFLLRNLGK
jgi:hypothetical protein